MYPQALARTPALPSVAWLALSSTGQPGARLVVGREPRGHRGPACLVWPHPQSPVSRGREGPPPYCLLPGSVGRWALPPDLHGHLGPHEATNSPSRLGPGSCHRQATSKTLGLPDSGLRGAHPSTPCQGDASWGREGRRASRLPVWPHRSRSHQRTGHRGFRLGWVQSLTQVQNRSLCHGALASCRCLSEGDPGCRPEL